MLVLARSVNESIHIDTPQGDRITVKVDRVKGDRVALAIDAPESILVNREEVTELAERSDRYKAQVVGDVTVHVFDGVSAKKAATLAVEATMGNSVGGRWGVTVWPEEDETRRSHWLIARTMEETVARMPKV